MTSTPKDRVNELIAALGMSKNQFAKEIGTSSSMISKVTTKEINFGIDLAEKIISTFRSVSPTWLLTGIGSMMLQNDSSDSPILSPSDSPNEKKWRQKGESSDDTHNANERTFESEKRITNVVEAQKVGGERARRWAQVRMLESRLYRRHPDLEPVALHEAFELSGVGTYSDQLLTYIINKTKHQIDDILMLLMDQKIDNESAISQIKAATTPLEALSATFITTEKAMFDMIRQVVQQYPETEEMIAGTPIALDIMGDIQFLTEEESKDFEHTSSDANLQQQFVRGLTDKLRGSKKPVEKHKEA